MTQQDLEALKATFPWRTQVVRTNIGGLVQLIDSRGQEVPIFTMTALLEFVTTESLREKGAVTL